jgi:hypothetical protein
LKAMTDLENKFRDLTADIHSKNDQVKNGGTVDMSRLAENVAVLCEEAQSLDAPEAHKIKPVMADLINALDELAESLKEFTLKNGTGDTS